MRNRLCRGLKLLSVRRNGKASIHVAAADKEGEEKWVQQAFWQMPPDVLSMVSFSGGDVKKFMHLIRSHFMSNLVMPRQWTEMQARLQWAA